MKVRTLAVAAVAGLTTSAMAQFTITPGGANAGNGYFALGAPATSATGSGASNGNFGATSPTIADQLFANQWWFRGPGDTREYAFANTTTAPLNMASTLVGNNLGTLDTGGYDYSVTNTTAGYAFRAEFRYRIEAGAFGPKVTYTANIVNLTPSSVLNLTMFNYHDFDANATAGGDTWSYVGDRYVITDGPVSLDYVGDFHDARQSTAYATLRGLLADTAVTNLDGTDVGSPGDFTAAYQWNVQIPGGGSILGISGSFSFIPAPSSLALLGLGGLLTARRRRA